MKQEYRNQKSGSPTDNVMTSCKQILNWLEQIMKDTAEDTFERKYACKFDAIL